MRVRDHVQSVEEDLCKHRNEIAILLGDIQRLQSKRSFALEA